MVQKRSSISIRNQKRIIFSNDTSISWRRSGANLILWWFWYLGIFKTLTIFQRFSSINTNSHYWLRIHLWIGIEIHPNFEWTWTHKWKRKNSNHLWKNPRTKTNRRNWNTIFYEVKQPCMLLSSMFWWSWRSRRYLLFSFMISISPLFIKIS